MKNKVFVIGFNKTGTTSITEALSKLGFKFCPEYVVYQIPSLEPLPAIPFEPDKDTE